MIAEKHLRGGGLVGEMESYKCLAPPLEPLDQVEGIEFRANKEVLSALLGLPIHETASKSVENEVIFWQKENSYLTLIRSTGTPSVQSHWPALAALTRPCSQTYSRSDSAL